ncbi:helix-turn-helix domain-containing protein [Fodinisporobacter ferrooxydans]|uniref:Helix-turn-helix domain-containing protein n=1 Tax=Fodinisporobacter ferrooxydans TaxID=2901836 RepID=A0ABY4CLG4_9BACL|nr:helix-turn-helix domain-containing protein [Alicyclobacillaceae bacterium MYW30-H2]
MRAEELGELLRWCRLEKGWTQQVLADYLRVDRSVVSRHENGEYFNLDIVKRWGMYTGYHEIVSSAVAEFCGFENQMAKKYITYERIINRLRADLVAIG